MATLKDVAALALVVRELAVPYFAELAGLVLRAARAHGWNVLIQQTLGTRAGERDALAALGPHVVDGAGAYGSPSLTTIAPDKTGIARAAVDLLRERVAGRDLPPRRVRTPFTLEIRESTVG